MRPLRCLAPVVVAALCLAATARPASAMGRYVNFGVVAWNADGTAALVMRISSSSGTLGITQEFILVGTRTQPFLITFDDTQNPDERRQNISVAACRSNAAILRRALIAARFRGVTIRAAHCETDRQVVVVSPAARSEQEATHLGDLGGRRPATTLELAVEAAVTALIGAVPAENDIVSKSGALIVLLSGVNGDESGPAHAAVIAADGKPRFVSEDLR